MAFTTTLISLALLSTAVFAQYPIGSPALGINPIANPGLTGYNPLMNSFNPALSGLSGMNPLLGGYGSSPLTAPYGGYGTNPLLSGLGLNAGLGLGLNGLNSFNPYALNGMNGLTGFNPLTGLSGLNGLNTLGYPQGLGLGLNAGLGLSGFPNSLYGNPLLSGINPYNRIPGLAY